MMYEKISASFEKHKERLKADQSHVVLFNYGNDLGMAARWGGVRHAVKVEDFIPQGGLADTQIDDLVSRMVDKLATRRNVIQEAAE